MIQSTSRCSDGSLDQNAKTEFNMNFILIVIVAAVVSASATTIVAPLTPPKLPPHFMFTLRSGPAGVPPTVVVVTTYWSPGKSLVVEPTPFGVSSTLKIRSPLTSASWYRSANADTCTFSCLNNQVCGPNGLCYDDSHIGVQVPPNATLAGTCNGPATQLWTVSCPNNGCTLLWCYEGAVPLWYSLAVGNGPPMNSTVVQWETRKIDPKVFDVPTNCTCPTS
jgi:hypothetical protein